VTHNVFDLEASRLVSDVVRNRVEDDDVITVFIDSLKLATKKTCCSVKHRLRLTFLMGGLGGREQDEIRWALKDALGLKAEGYRGDGCLSIPDTELQKCRGLQTAVALADGIA
jgi:hypothetical protein